jgi:hypothetical protein
MICAIMHLPNQPIAWNAGSQAPDLGMSLFCDREAIGMVRPTCAVQRDNLLYDAQLRESSGI